MFSIFKKKAKRITGPGWGLSTDVHSHLLPGIDDGAKDLEETKELIEGFQEMGIRKIITTPHIYPDFYPNTEAQIRNHLVSTRSHLSKTLGSHDIELRAAAEYFLDESFIAKLDTDHQFLTFGNKYLLFELSFINEPMFLKEAIFKMQSKGLKPVLAHPERYAYFHENWQLIEDLFDRGVILQLNLLSITGYYSRAIQDLAIRMIKENMINMVGSDCHNIEQMKKLRDLNKTKHLDKLLEKELINNDL